MNSSLGGSSSSSSSSSKSEDEKQKRKALFVVADSKLGKLILDSGASHHMASSQTMFSSFETCSSPPILMAKNTSMSVGGKGSIDIDDGSFNDVLCVPSLSTNILSIYQITHGGARKSVEFTLDFVIIQDLHSRDIVAIGEADHQF